MMRPARGQPCRRGRRHRFRDALITAGPIVLLVTIAPPSYGASWPVPLTAGSGGQATSDTGPAAPGGITSACSGLISKAVVVSWTAVPHATSYTIYQSTTSATGPYIAVATAGASPWTSGSLALGTYWYEVDAVIGTGWRSLRSAATAQRTIIVTACT